MKLSNLYIFLLQPNNYFIKNSEYPICKNCVFFKKDDKFPDDLILGKCLLFGKQNIISGEINYEYADIIRKDKDLCNIKGKFYKRK